MKKPIYYRLALLLGIAVLWGGSFAGALGISRFDLAHWDALCGPWGCLPATAPLLSVHAMWLTLVGGIALGMRFAVPMFGFARIWWGLHLGCIAVLVLLVAVDANSYVQLGGDTADIGRRAVYALLIWTDVPIVQCALASLACACTCSPKW